MSHQIIIMNQCTDALRGNATSGQIKELQDEFNRVDTVIEMGGPNHPAHELMESIQAWLCDGGDFQLSACAQVENFITDLKQY